VRYYWYSNIRYTVYVWFDQVHHGSSWFSMVHRSSSRHSNQETFMRKHETKVHEKWKADQTLKRVFRSTYPSCACTFLCSQGILTTHSKTTQVPINMFNLRQETQIDRPPSFLSLVMEMTFKRLCMGWYGWMLGSWSWHGVWTVQETSEFTQCRI
jgi:hypothetical protein